MVLNSKIRDLAEKVKAVLEADEAARDDDVKLYIKVAWEYYPIDLSRLAFTKWAALVKEKRLPSLESVGRARRKCQELYPDLRGEAYRGRIDKEEEYIDFARDKSV